jgi:hypothetical protein
MQGVRCCDCFYEDAEWSECTECQVLTGDPSDPIKFWEGPRRGKKDQTNLPHRCATNVASSFDV